MAKQSTKEITNDPWEVFVYELEMYWATIKIREDIGTARKWGLLLVGNESILVEDRNQFIMNALIESKLLHIRILCEIILKDKKGNDDIVLCDLLPDWKDDNKLVAAVQELKKVYGKSSEAESVVWKINKLMAHPTTKRTSWADYGLLFKAIDPRLKECLLDIARLSGKPELLDLTSNL